MIGAAEGSEENAHPTRQTRHAISPWYFGILHKNLNEHRRAPLDYGSISTEPLASSAKQKWQKIRQNVLSSEFRLRHSAEQIGDDSGAHLTDLAKTSSYEFRLQECLFIFIALLAVGVIAYSFVFEHWTIIDSLYFTVVMLTTCGSGDLSPTTPGGKVFASMFAISGIVLLGLILGVVGSNLVEVEVEMAHRMQTETSSAIERAFSKRSSNNLNSETADDTDTDSTCSSVNDEEKHESSHHVEEPSWFSVLLGEIPAYTPLLLGGLAMGLMEHWKWYDSIYYTVVTATTIGFGDIVPVHEYSRAFAIIFIPVAVASMGYITGDIASYIVEKKRNEYYKRLWSAEIGISDIEALDVNHKGGVCALEYIKFMLVAMKKIDGALFDELRNRFEELDMSGNGMITKEDVMCMAKKRAKRIKNKLKLREYKKSLMRHRRSISSSFRGGGISSFGSNDAMSNAVQQLST